MKTISRNPDVDLDKTKGEVPAGYQLIRGKNLHHTARARAVPFGEATAVNRSRGYGRRETVGLVILEADVPRFKAALEVRGKYQPVATRRGA